METRKKRRAWIAALLSILLPGVGQLYNGQIIKALILYGIGIILGVSLHVCFANFYSLAVLIVLVIGLYFFALIDSIYHAVKQKAISLRGYNRWYIYLLVFIINAIINAYLLSYPYKSYTIPASSMEPSLRVGDRFIAEKKQYVLESLNRGDIVIFPYPDDPAREFVKRIIGLPHDKVEIVNKRVLINDQPIQEPYIQHISEEIFPQESSPRDNFGPVVVPSDSIFLLGDNRDSSLDSRFWENRYVKIRDITGKPLYLYWAKEMARIGQTLR